MIFYFIVLLLGLLIVVLNFVLGILTYLTNAEDAKRKELQQLINESVLAYAKRGQKRTQRWRRR